VLLLLGYVYSSWVQRAHVRARVQLACAIGDARACMCDTFVRVCACKGVLAQVACACADLLALTCARAWVCTCTCACTRAHTSTRMCTCTRAHVHARIPTYF